MQYMKVKGTTVIKILASSSVPAGAQVLPKGHHVQVGDDIRFFDANYKRKSVEQCSREGLIKNDEHSYVQWKGGRYTVKTDYTKENYWYKDSGKKVRFALGEKPDESMTGVKPFDSEAKWDEDKGLWYVSDEVYSRRIREERNALLRGSDFTMLEDAPVKDKVKWKEYRQALRDITKQKGFPKEVIWPVAPEEAEIERLFQADDES